MCSIYIAHWDSESGVLVARKVSGGWNNFRFFTLRFSFTRAA